MTEYRVAVLLLLDMNCRMEVMFHRQVVGDELGLVLVTTAGAANIQFLQCHNIRMGARDHAGYAAG